MLVLLLELIMLLFIVLHILLIL